MKHNSIVTLSIFSIALFIFSCDYVIHPDLEKAEPVLVIDAWLNDAPGTQKIKLNARNLILKVCYHKV